MKRQILLPIAVLVLAINSANALTVGQSVSADSRDATDINRTAAKYRSEGNRYYDVSQFEKAAASLKEAIRLRPDYAEAYNDLGMAFIAMNKHEEAIDSLKQAIRCKPDFATGYCNLGSEYYQLGELEKAIEFLQRAINLKPDYALAFNNLGARRWVLLC